MKTFYLLIILFAINGCAAIKITDNKFVRKLDVVAKNALAHLKGVPGLAIAVVKDNSIIYLKSHGWADLEKNIPATVQTPYYIASTTKSFTATIAQILDRENTIDIHTPITQYKPIKNFQNKGVFKNITIRDLLTHTSGISNGYLVWRNAVSGQFNDSQLIEILESHTTTLNNHKKFKYDNLGYNIFDIILRKEYGLNWKNLVNKKLFQPLKMDRTTAFYDKIVDENWIVAQPYIAIGDTSRPVKVNLKKNNKTMQAAGGMYASIKDIANWLLFNINEGYFNKMQVYEKDIWKEIQHSYAEVKDKEDIFLETGYGIGWHTALYNKKNVLYHNGGFLGYSAKISFIPEEKIGIAVLVNESFFGDNLADLLTSFTFSYFLNDSISIEDIFIEIKALEEKMVHMNTSYAKSMSRVKQRQSSLDLNLNAYEGEYRNEGFGTFTISNKGERLSVEMGLLQSSAMYGQANNSLIVEFLGPGSKDEINFTTNSSTVESLTFKGLEFKKIR